MSRRTSEVVIRSCRLVMHNMPVCRPKTQLSFLIEPDGASLSVPILTHIPRYSVFFPAAQPSFCSTKDSISTRLLRKIAECDGMVPSTTLISCTQMTKTYSPSIVVYVIYIMSFLLFGLYQPTVQVYILYYTHI